MIFSIFILLNARVCYSSQHYYIPNTSCFNDNTAECQRVHRLGIKIYGIEVAFSIVLVTHGFLTMALADNLKTKYLISFIMVYSRCSLFVYTLLLACRYAIYYALITNHLSSFYEYDWFNVIFAI